MSDENDSGSERVTMPFKWVTAGYDARYPTMNQTKHCWQTYVDYHKCITAKGDDFPACKQFQIAYRALCPLSWVERWDDQLENGIFPVKFDK